jgi:hypothetical protein
MNGRVAKRLRRENPTTKPKQLFKPFMVEIEGVDTYIPRAQRRKAMRKLMTDVRKGRLQFNDTNGG